jgi:cell division protein FtsL
VNVRATALRQPAPRTRPQTQTRDHLRVAPDVRRRRRRARLVVFGVTAVTVLSLFTLVAFHVFEVQSAFTLERLDKQRTNEQLRYERLREDVAQRSSPLSVIAAARALGLEQANSMTFLQAPAAAPRQTTDSGPQSLATPTYGKTKEHLGPNP